MNRQRYWKIKKTFIHLQIIVMSKKILFIDRDGTIIKEPEDEQIDSLEKLEFLPKTISSLKKLQESGYILVMVSNQDGLWTVSFPTQDFEIPQNKMLQILCSEWIIFDEIFICPHFQKDNCNCRKPKLWLLETYVKENNIDYEKSYVIWDRESDSLLAQNIWIQWLRISDEFWWQEICKSILERKFELVRKTNETDISIKINLDWIWNYTIDTGLKFFDHMLEQLSKHSWIDMKILVTWDLQVDEHHTIEDVAIALSESIYKALWSKRWIWRYWFVLPMDESKTEISIDLWWRRYLIFEWNFVREYVWDMPTEMVKHFFKSFADWLQATINVTIDWENDHHKIESSFKALAKCLNQALRIEWISLPTTKGVL